MTRHDNENDPHHEFGSEMNALKIKIGPRMNSALTITFASHQASKQAGRQTALSARNQDTSSFILRTQYW